MYNTFRVEAATYHETYVEWWPIREWAAPYSEVLEYVAKKEKKYPNTTFRIVEVL